MNTFRSLLRRVFIFGLLLATLTSASAFAESNIVRVRMQTNMGVMVFELDSKRAPLTVANFLQYVHDGQYDGTIFHRVIPGFVVQGGGYTDKNIEKPTRADIFNEAGNGLSNRRGTVAMARTDNPHSANAQFYINLADNAALDPQPGRWGYAVFGRVIEGMEVAQKISEVATGISGPFEDAPIKQVVIEKATVVQ